MWNLFSGKQTKNKHFETSSFLDSLNESRDDSINDSISNNAYDQNEGGSEVASVFNMGTEKFMGSEKHFMSEKFEYSESNAGQTIDDASSINTANFQNLKKKVRRVSKRKDGPVKMDYTGKASMPVESPQANLKGKNQIYTGSISYTGPKGNAMVSENEINNSRRLFNYDDKEGEGIRLTTDENQKENEPSKEQENPSESSMSFFAAMSKYENEKTESIMKANLIKEGMSYLKKPLETIAEENNKSEAFTESKTMDKDTTN
jgi:hypothetical protein